MRNRIICIVVMFIGINCLVTALLMTRPKTYDKAKWGTEYAKVVTDLVDIKYNEIMTTDSEYTKLRDGCNKYINEFDVDTKDSDSNNKKTIIKTETGPLYFNNMLMLRYKDNKGKVKVATTLYNDNNLETIILDDLYKFKSYTQIESIDIDTNTTISEDEYISLAGNAVKEILEANEIRELNKAESEAIKVFTVDGKEGVFKYKDTLDIATVDIRYAEFCRTDIKKEIKDRVYMQIEIGRENGDKELVSMIMKINKYNRIFDMDIL